MTGVDHRPQPRYPFRFVQADALDYVAAHGHAYEAIFASPPCQAYTLLATRHRGAGGRADRQPALVAATRQALETTGRPWVLENVPGAPLRWAICLTGARFGLRVHRPRLFEASVLLLAPPAAPRPPDPVAVYGAMDGRRLWTRADGTSLRACQDLAEAQAAMGIDWMTWAELREAVPPAYTAWIGAQLRRQLGARGPAP